MNTTVSPYERAGEIFDTFRGKTELITDAELSESGVVIRSGHMTNVEGVEVFGEREGERAAQRLSLGKNGIYYLATTFLNPGGRVERKCIGPNSPETSIDVLEDSLFVEALKKIAQTREIGKTSDYTLRSLGHRSLLLM